MNIDTTRGGAVDDEFHPVARALAQLVLKPGERSDLMDGSQWRYATEDLIFKAGSRGVVLPDELLDQLVTLDPRLLLTLDRGRESRPAAAIRSPSVAPAPTGSRVAGIIRGLAVAVWVLGAIAGFAVGLLWGAGSPGTSNPVGVVAMLATWVYSFLGGVFLNANAELLENVAQLRSIAALQLEIGTRQAEVLSRLLAGVQRGDTHRDSGR